LAALLGLNALAESVYDSIRSKISGKVL